MAENFTSRTFKKASILFIISSIFFGAITYNAIFTPGGMLSEYGFHIRKSKEMLTATKILEPHFLFHVLTIFSYEILNFSKIGNFFFISDYNLWRLAGLLASTASYSAITMGLFFLIRRTLTSESASVAIAFSISI